MSEKPSIAILQLRIVDAAVEYFHTVKGFERTEGDEEADKELQKAEADLLRACGTLLRELRRSRSTSGTGERK